VVFQKREFTKRRTKAEEASVVRMASLYMSFISSVKVSITTKQ